MKQLNDQDRLLLSSLSDIERVLDNVDLSTNQIEKIWGSFKTIRDIVYGIEEETITRVVTTFNQLETKDECVQFIKKYLEQNTLCTLDIINFKNIIEILQKKEKTMTGVITAPLKEPRSVAELVIELYGHPDYVGGTIFIKDDIMETIKSDLEWSNDLYEEGEEEYMTDDEIADKAEQLYKLNYGRLNEAIHDICSDSFDSVDFTDYMTYDLSKIQKTNTNEDMEITKG